MARDAACRPHELLNLKIRDVTLTQDQSGQWYAEITVNGKTGTRTLGLFYSVPFFKNWLQDHPVKGNPNAPLFCAEQNKRNFGRRLTHGAMYTIYTRVYKKQYFPKLVEQDPTVPPEDKKKIADLLQKPWNPYLVHRHSTLTHLAREKGLSDSLFETLAGWRLGSPMRKKYVHLDGGEASKAMLKLRGVKFESEEQERLATQSKNALRPVICPDCKEVNEAAAKFCANPKCRMVLAYDKYKPAAEALRREEEQLEQKHERLEEMMHKLEGYQHEILRLFEPHLKQIKDEKQRNNEVAALLFHGPGILQEQEEEEDQEVQEISSLMNEENEEEYPEAAETVDLL